MYKQPYCRQYCHRSYHRALKGRVVDGAGQQRQPEGQGADKQLQ